MAKESLVRFQPFIEGEKVLLVMDHSVLTWAKMYKNVNRRLAAWGLVFATFPEMVIVHQPGRAHSNVDPLSRLPRIPTFTSPARNDLPEPVLTTEHEELQKAWLAFIKERELAVEAKTTTTRATRRPMNKENMTSMMSKAAAQKTAEGGQAGTPYYNSQLHVYASEGTIKWITEGYAADKDFTNLFNCVRNEKSDERKYRAYCMGRNGLLYFEDANMNIRLCIPASEHEGILKEVHDGAHESAHTGWE